MTKIHTVCINGSRGFSDYNFMEAVTNQILLELVENYTIKIISGGAKGADTLAEKYAAKNKYEFELYPAFWDLYGKGAGYKRNVEMIDACDSLISFWDMESRGTKHAIDYARKIGKPVTIVNIGD